MPVEKKVQFCLRLNQEIDNYTDTIIHNRIYYSKVFIFGQYYFGYKTVLW